MDSESEGALLQTALELLADRLPPGWRVERSTGQGAGSRDGDAIFTFIPPSGSSGTALVTAHRTLTPADVERFFLGGFTRRLRDAAGGRTIMVISEFLSPRTRELLANEAISYLDLAGNIRLVIDYPGIFVDTDAARQPRPPQRRARTASSLAGAQVGRVVRLFAEVVPPYGVLDIEQATGISRGYVSRILDRLSAEGLIERQPRGAVTDVDWPELLRRRGRSADLFRASTTVTYAARTSPRDVLAAVAASPRNRDLVVTGSFAAERTAPVAAPALLTLYVNPAAGPRARAELEQEFDLFPLEPDEGADVALLFPSNSLAIEDTRVDDGLQFANLSQVVIDCIGGTGRMPAEGEAVLEWMRTNPSDWQYPSLHAYLARPR